MATSYDDHLHGHVDRHMHGHVHGHIYRRTGVPRTGRAPAVLNHSAHAALPPPATQTKKGGDGQLTFSRISRLRGVHARAHACTHTDKHRVRARSCTDVLRQAHPNTHQCPPLSRARACVGTRACTRTHTARTHACTRARTHACTHARTYTHIDKDAAVPTKN